MRLILLLLTLAVPRLQLVFHVGAVTEATPKAAQTIVDMAKKLDADIVIELDGPGGNVGHGYDAVQILAQSKIALTCIIRDKAFSMDAWIFEMVPCHRMMAKDALIVLHRPVVDQAARQEQGLTRKEAQEGANFAEHMLCEFVASKTGDRVQIDECEEQLDKSPSHTWAFDAELAQRKGMVDEVF